MRKDIACTNRELSWIEFNFRVLYQAFDKNNPLLERLKFIAITASNLDEFIMVRVGGLMYMRKKGKRRKDPSGMTPYAQLKAINKRVNQMYREQYTHYSKTLEPALAEKGFNRKRYNELSPEQKSFLSDYVSRELAPVLTPSAVELGAVKPLIHNLELHILARIQGDKKDRDKYAVMPLGFETKRFIILPSEAGRCEFILLEDAVKAHISNWFEGCRVLECCSFRPTRNADIELQEDEAPDLLTGMEEVLEERKSSDCIRLEIESGMSEKGGEFLRELLECGKRWTFRLDGPLNLKAFMDMTSIEGFESLKNEPWQPQPSDQIDPSAGIFEQIQKKDILLYHPYESFDPVIRFVEEAAGDPSVLSIKLVIYRTSSKSPMVAALKRAAENGKYVTALLELKARFDERSNIEWARMLENSGVQVIYGVKGLKTHSKVCVVVRREEAGVVRYVHYGTGNYNDKTAKLYSDISYMTCNEALGFDATAFFNSVSGYSQPQNLRRLYMSPITLRKKITQMIEAETERAKNSQKAEITAKMNSLVDKNLIEKLYAASQAGVEIKLNVRGICCLKPGVEGLSENITVTSIVDRFLEHARIYCFYHGGNENIFISSADWMTRNLDKRVELLVPIDSANCKKRLKSFLNTHLADNVSSWTLLPDGSYKKNRPKKGEKRIRSQEQLYLQACRRTERKRGKVVDQLTPHMGENY
ncbi:Polyphosphate kinase [Sedimentisphaera cyanobacteriorum]|uniref:Polyphosphate kinase n=1 Tax=Sedimentisphaera cyanobacteriorum TaxID=1940790 RepID=A0A1Q2HSW7_9BACT|nr:polyphosphate kinase 1 [Sedimentisphaera cyanobacteriorum]AQQ10384.1 Polyphosphate kinase [Sedimentisphaera cyanobacteriorum]